MEEGGNLKQKGTLLSHWLYALIEASSLQEWHKAWH